MSSFKFTIVDKSLIVLEILCLKGNLWLCFDKIFNKNSWLFNDEKSFHFPRWRVTSQ